MALIHSPSEVPMLAALLCCLSLADAPKLDCLEPNKDTGTSLAIVVDETPLVHTSQMFPTTKERGDAGKELTALLDRLAKDLSSTKSDLSRVVKLNLHLARSRDVAVVQKTLAKRFTDHRPAVCISIGTPAVSGVRVSLDAVAVAGVTPKPGIVQRINEPNATQLAVLPAGPVYYVSGQAERGLDLGRATRHTLESLRGTLKQLGREDSHVVQIKAFVNPMDKLDEVRKEIEAFYGKDKVPPVVLVEWTYPQIEIELIAVGAPAARAEAAIEYITPEGMSSSPVFSRVTRINHGRRVYTSGIPGVGANGEAQVKDVFARVEGVLKSAKSDVRHLAKATYLVSDEETSKQLNTQRLKLYDPKRPPAASKAGVRATGVKDCTLVIDLIGVSVP